VVSRERGWMPSRALGERHDGLLAVGGHPSVDMPPHVVEAATRAAGRPTYAPTLGLRELRVSIAERLGAELGRAIDPDREVIVTLGGMQALHLAAASYGARSVTHAPSFFFPQLVAETGGRCVATGGEDGQPDWDAFAAAIGPDTTLAFVSTPVNPTGDVLRRADLDAIADAVEGSDCVLLSDEAYAGLVWDGAEHVSPATHPALAERTLVVRSFSKTHAMAAWRIGYAAGPAAVVAAMARGLGWQALAVDGVAQAAALAALTGPQQWLRDAIGELAGMRPRAVAAANASGVLRAELPDGAAFLWAAIHGDEDEASERLATEHGIPALPGRHFAARRPHLRIPFGGRPEARAALLERLAALRPPGDA
jgi:aspartate/methionine/tyrosine aminotransferase